MKSRLETQPAKASVAAAAVDTLLGKLGTAEGEALAGALARRLAGALSPDGHDLEFLLGRTDHLPEDRFERSLLVHLKSEVATPQQAGRLLPGALAGLLLSQARGGQVKRSALERALGPSAVRFFDQLTAVGDSATDPLAGRHAFGPLDRAELARRVEAANMKPPKMAALDYLVKELGPGTFEGMQGFALQHLFSSTVSLFLGLEASGLPLERMKVLGKNYSTNPATAAWLRAADVSVHPTSERVEGDYGAAMKRAIHEQLAAIVRTLPDPPEQNPAPRVLLLDDGGEAIAHLHEAFPQHVPYFVGVEQTRRGAKRLAGLKLRMPVANVAESWAKLELESPMIARSVTAEIGKKLEALSAAGVFGERTGTADRPALVVGFGAVGAAVAHDLSGRGLSVHVFDPDPDRRAEAASRGFTAHADLTDALPFAEVLVSCAGTRTLSNADHELLPNGAILFNAASANDEFGDSALGRKAGAHVDEAGRVWQKFRGVPIDTGPAGIEAHRDEVWRRPSSKEALRVRSGYVVNMTGEADPIPPRYIQLTRALLFAGAVAARRSDHNGLIAVPDAWQKAVVKWVRRDLARTGESLEAPRWKTSGPVVREAPPAAHALTDDDALSEFYPEVDETHPPGEDLVHGYRLGPVRPGTREAWIDAVLGDGDGTLSVPEAALDRALFAVNRYFKVEIRASASPDSPELGLGRPARPLEEKTVAAPEDPRTAFALAFHHYLEHLAERALEAIHGRAPSRAELEAALEAIRSTSSVPLSAPARPGSVR